MTSIINFSFQTKFSLKILHFKSNTCEWAPPKITFFALYRSYNIAPNKSLLFVLSYVLYSLSNNSMT